MASNDNPRKRGILSQADREYLQSDSSEYSRQAAHARKNEISERIQNAILDFHVLLSGYNPTELASTMGTVENWDKAKQGLVTDGITDGIGFLTAAAFFTSANRINCDPSEPSDYESFFEMGVTRAARYHGFALESVDVNVSFEATESTAIEERELTDMPLRTLRQLYFGGEITEEQLNKAFREQQKRNRLDEVKNRLESGKWETIDHRDIEDLWAAERLSDEEYIDHVEQWEQWWKDTREARIEEEGPRRRVIYDVLNRAKRQVEYAEKREESRKECLNNLDDRLDDGNNPDDDTTEE